MKKKDKNIFIITILIMLFFLAWTLSRYSSVQNDSKESQGQKTVITSTQKTTKQEVKKIIPAISATELNAKMLSTETLTIVDARSIDLFRKSHIKNSVPLSVLNDTHPSKTIVFVTETGEEDNILSHYNNLSGQYTIYNLEGGFAEWTKRNFNIISFTITQNFENVSKVQFVEPRDVHPISIDDAVKNEIVIIDTRREGNYEKEHIPNSINIPFLDLEYRYKEIPASKQIYVYGTDEITSFNAGVLMYDLNFINIKTINGGLDAWKEFGYPVTSNNAP